MQTQCSAEMQFPGFVILRRVVAFSGIWHELRRGGVYRRNVSRAAGALTILWKQYKKSIGKKWHLGRGRGGSLLGAEPPCSAAGASRRSFHKGHILRPSRFHRSFRPILVSCYDLRSRPRPHPLPRVRPIPMGSTSLIRSARFRVYLRL